MRVAARLASTSIATSTVRDGSATRPCNASNAPLVMPSVIANEFTEATEPFHLQSLFVVGTLLLLITLVINVLGKLVVSRISETIA